MAKTLLFSLFFVSSCLRGATASAQPAPDPELERQSFQIADGFEVSLYAADPLLAKPVQMNFDPAGRLWVATSEIYPQIKPGQVADDKILVLEDADGDHKVEKATVFARGLLIPTAVLPGDGGAYVANSTEILHMTDTDGDGKADASRVVLSGFGTEDTHHIIHTFRWGHDGIFYFNQSVYIHSHVETPYGPRRLPAGGTWAYRPETQRLEVFTRGLINHWGHAWDKHGNSFFTDGAGGQGINYGFTGTAFVSINDQAPRILAGLNPGSPKFAGAEVVSGRHFPDDWQGDIVTNDFRANRVVRFKLSDDGAGFSSKLMPDLIKTKDKAFRPVDVKMGPDGALYIADWYNPIINHGEVDFRDPRRDKTHGRIWRVTAKGRPPVEMPKLANATIEHLLNQLKAPEDYTRRQARLVLREMDKAKVLPALDQWTASLPTDDDFTRLQSLWTYQTLNHPNPTLLTTLLKSKDPNIRTAATRVLADWSAPSQAQGFQSLGADTALPLLRALIADAHPRVRLEATRALATLPTPQSADLALSILDKPLDRFLDYALYLTLTDLEPAWLPAFQSGQLTFDHNPRKLEVALKAVRNPAAVKPLVAALQANKLSPDSRGEIINLIAQLGTPEDLAVLFDTALTTTDAPTRLALLQSLDRAARTRNARPKADAANLKALVTGQADDATRAAALRLAGAFKLAALRPDVTALATSADAPPPVRAAAIATLADLADKSTLAQLAAAPQPPAIRVAAIAALADADPRAAAPRAAALLAENATDADLAPAFAAFIKKKDGPKALAAALTSKAPTADNAKLALRAIYALGHSDPALITPLQSAAGISSQPKQLSPDEMKQLLADVQSKGDPARGEDVFRRADTSCLKCHAIAGAGGQLAPDLTSLGSAPLDYLVESILEPNKAIKEGYHAVIVETVDGDQFTGIKIRQTDRDLILRDAVQDEIAIPLKDIKGKPRDATSMMPAGLADPLTRQELIDLARFLAELGRPGPFAVGATPVARRWELLDSAQVESAKPGQPLNLKPEIWTPAYAKVSGDLPLPGDKPVLIRCQVNVTTGGRVALKPTAPAGAALWIDGAPVGDTTVDLKPGIHTVTIRATPASPDAALRLELADVPGSAAKAQFVTGR